MKPPMAAGSVELGVGHDARTRTIRITGTVRTPQ